MLRSLCTVGITLGVAGHLTAIFHNPVLIEPLILHAFFVNFIVQIEQLQKKILWLRYSECKRRLNDAKEKLVVASAALQAKTAEIQLDTEPLRYESSNCQGAFILLSC
jgi:hypothetical protein